MPATAVARGQNPRGAPRGPASSRRGGSRTDRDGDVSMGAAVKGRARVGKAAILGQTSTKDAPARSKRAGGRPGPLTNGAKSAILKHVGGGDVGMRDSRATAPKGKEVDIELTGWDKSKCSSQPDGGVKTLLLWLERKASLRLGSRKSHVKVIRHRVETLADKTLFITVRQEDANAILRMNGYEWAGVKVTMKQVGGTDPSQNAATADTKAFLRGVLESRYNPETKLLDLSALHLDAALQAKHVFDAKSTTGKIFPAMMRVLELCFDTAEERHSAIESVTLANNDLPDLKMVTTLSETLPKLHNLDLSNNKFESLSALHLWRRRFSQLRQIIVSGNPLEQAEPNYPAEIIQWYPNLRTLNGMQVRTEEEIAQKVAAPELAFPIRNPSFQDEGGIAENFIRTFFAGFDTDRSQLAALYYDEKSDFSFGVNTGAPRDPAAVNQPEKQEWEHYIKNSRNLKKLSQLQARQNRLFRGPKAIAEAMAAMPKTKHPDLATEARKWLIEAHIQPGVPDLTGQAPGGVDGFFITVHGEFEEVSTAPNGGQQQQPGKKRSFDRTFILGPGGTSGVRIVNDMLTVRAYGGAQAFDPDIMEAWGPSQQQQAAGLPAIDAPPQLPAGLTIEMAEQMVTELQKQTNMTLQYAKDCLDQVGWEFQKALEAFASVKANLPPQAFVSPAAQ